MIDELDEDEIEEEELEELLPMLDRMYISDEQMEKLSNFKKRVDKALKEKNSEELKKLLEEKDEITSEENKEDKHFKKCFSYLINRNPLYLKLSIKEIKELFK